MNIKDLPQGSYTVVKKTDPGYAAIPGIQKVAQGSGQSIVGDITEAAKNVLPSAVKTAGGFASMAMHPLDTTESIARTAYGGVQELFGKKDENTPYFDALVKNLKDRYGSIDKVRETFRTDPVGFAVDVGSALEGAGAVSGSDVLAGAGRAINPLSIVGKVTGAATHPFVDSTDEVTSGLFKKEGVPAPVSVTTKSGAVKMLESFGDVNLRDKIASSFSAIKDKTSSLISDIKNISQEGVKNALLPENVGQEVQKTIETSRAVAGKVLGEFKDKFGDTAIVPSEVLGTLTSNLQKIIDEESKTLGNIGQRDVNTVKGILSDITGNIPREVGALSGALKKQAMSAIDSTKITFNNLDKTLSNIGPLVENNPILRRVYGALNEAKIATVESADAGAGKILREMNSAFSSLKSEASDAIMKSNPENVLNVVKPNNSTMLNQYKSLVGDKNWASFTGSFLLKAIDAASKDGFLDMEKFKSFVSSFDTPTLNALLTPDQIKSLDTLVAHGDNLNALQEALKGAEKQPSLGYMQKRIGFQFLRTLATAGAGGLFGFAAATKQFAAIGGLVAAFVLGDKAFTTFISSDIGQAYLRGEGLPIIKNLKIPAYVGGPLRQLKTK